MIKQIKLKNFGPHKNLELKFTENTVIQGDNGTGKSYIFYAIGKALFLYNQYRLNEMIMLGQNECEITVEFLDKNNKVCFVYNKFFSDGSSSVYEASDSHHAVKGLLAVEEFIRDKLGIPNNLSLQRLWTEVVGSSHTDFTRSLLSDNTKRTSIFSALLGVSDYQKCTVRLSVQIKELESELKTLEFQLKKELSESSESLKEKLKSKEEQREIGLKKLNDLKAAKNNSSVLLEIEKLKNELIQLKMLSARQIKYIEACTEYQTISDSLQTDIDFSARSNLAVLKHTITQQKTELKNLSDSKVCLLCGQETDNSKRIEELKNEIEKNKVLYNETKLSVQKLEEHEKAKDKLKQIKPSLSYLKVDLGNYDNQIKLIEDKIVELQKQTDGNFIDINELNKEEVRIEEGLNTLNAHIVYINKLIKISKEEEDRQKKLTEELNEIKNKIFKLHYLKEFFKNLGPLTLQNQLLNISNRANNILSEMATVDFKIMWNQDFSIEVYRKDTKQGFHLLSAGEKTLVALSLKLAITDFLSAIPFLLLDEPTAHLSSNNRNRLAENLQKLTKQLIVIVHDNDFQKYCSTYIKTG